METTHHERHHHEEREVTHERGGKGTVWDPSGMIWSEAARKDLDRIKNTQGLSDEDRAKNIQRVVDRELEMSEHPFWRELLKDSYSGLKWSLKVTFVAGVVYYTFKAMAMAAVGAGAAQVSSSHMEGLQPAA